MNYSNTQPGLALSFSLLFLTSWEFGVFKPSVVCECVLYDLGGQSRVLDFYVRHLLG
ncbi:hypothetical protein KC19_5G028000 [Ceratodon purpureus]|uniref:Uncharacterized protein n=1 Tax=Ceratodon purpureus TaxID=3225 RepID=A0A8T0HYI0_CERPU|nr:hypothetical protein KC19_5G028000 [Ceratodon purpureus]